MEDNIKQAIKQAGALLRQLRYNKERKGWMVEYDRNTRLCICVENDPSDYDYASDAWSCDSLCYLVFVNDKVRVYSLAEDVPSEYDASLVLDNFEDFVHYIKKFFVKESANIYNYLKQVYSEVVNARTECDYRELSPSEILCDIFYSEMGNEYPNELIKVASEALSGVVYGRKTVRPNKILVCNNVLPRFFDVVVMLESISANETEANLKLQNAQFRSVDSLFLPEIAASHLAGITLKECKKKESLKIFDPFVWGTSVLLNIVRRIRSNTPDAEIHIKGYSLSKYPEKILDCLFASYGVNVKIENDISMVEYQNQWLGDSDIITCLPPYRTLTKLLTRQEIPIDESRIYTIENFPFVMMRKCIENLSENGICLINIPLHYLKDVIYTTERHEINTIAALRRIETLGCYVTKETYGPICSLVVSHKNNASNYLTYRWNEDKEFGFDESLRENIKKKARVLSLNDDILCYRVPPTEIDVKDWSPKPFSDSAIIRNIREGLNNKDIPLVCADRIFNINSGVRTGFIRAFSISKNEFNCLDQNQKTYFAPYVNSISLQDCRLNDVNYLFYPYRGTSNRINNEKELSKLLPFFYKYLINNKHLIERFRSARLKSNWWELVYRNSTHDPGTHKIVSLVYGSKGSFAFDETGDFVVCGANQWIPKNSKQNEESLMFAYLAIFSSDYFWKLIDIYAEKMNVGTNPKWKLNVSMLKSLPIPDLIECRDVVDTLAIMGRNIHLYGSSALSPELEDIVTRLYNGTY